VNDFRENPSASTKPPGASAPQPPAQAARASAINSSCRRTTSWLARHHKAILVVAALAFASSSFFAGKLYADLRSGLEELLPNTAPSVVAARTIAPKLHNVNHLSVVLEGANGDALDRFADDLAARLRKLPNNLVQSVQYRIDAQEAFFRRFGGLYLSVKDLDSIQSRLDARIRWEKKKANPFLHLLGEEAIGSPPPLDFRDIERKYGFANHTFPQFRKGYFQTPDGHLLVLLVTPPESATSLSENERILDAVQKEVKALSPKRYDPSLRVGYDAEVATLTEEQAALKADLVSSSVVVIVLVLLALWVFFRRITPILAVVGALALGCSLTFGLAYFLVGHLNANTAFLGSIVVGNGINVSIIVVARFIEERGRGLSLEEALSACWSGTAAATFVASFGAGLAYLSLAVTDFRGFNQFGLIGGMGMALCWLTAYLLLPALLAALDSRSRQPFRGRISTVGTIASWLVYRHGKAVRRVSLLLVAVSVLGLLTYRGPLFQYDFSKLQSAKSARSGATYFGKKADQVFRAFLTPIVVRADSPADLRRFVEELERERGALGAADPLREVRTVDNVIPQNQAEKLRRLSRLRATLTDTRLSLLDPRTRREARDLRPSPDLRQVTLDDLPQSIRLPLIERDGTAGRIALIFPKRVGWASQREMKKMADLIRDAIARSGASAQAVGQNLLFNDIIDAIVRDGPKATVLALAAVVSLVLVTLQHLRPALQVLAGLLLGVAWLLGAAAWVRMRINFLNFVVLPITFGIGVDYSVNIVQRWRLEGAGSLERVLKGTGGAVALCSLTTIIGYGSLLAADNQALRSFGLFASLGELSCILAAVVALPAWLQRQETRRSTSAARRTGRFATAST